MNIIIVGIDLAKNVFAVHGVNDSGKPALVKPKVSRADLLPLIAQLLFFNSYQRSAPSVCVVLICSPPWRLGS